MGRVRRFTGTSGMTSGRWEIRRTGRNVPFLYILVPLTTRLRKTRLRRRSQHFGVFVSRYASSVALHVQYWNVLKSKHPQMVIMKSPTTDFA